ncbi:MAG: CBS domain-containing protein [Gammaproteobacteria bacterium]
MNIANIMSNQIVTVEMDDSLSVVKDIFDHTKFHHLLVIDSNKLSGIISDRDLLKAISPNIGTLAESSNDLCSLNKKAHQIMTRNPVAIHEEATMNEAIILFNKHKLSCFPVINKKQNPVGILSWRDIFKSLES